MIIKNFSIGEEPIKRKNLWIVTIYIRADQAKPLIDSELSFKTKHDAKLFISGWLELEDHLGRC
jgi:hypothetical protein